METKKQIEYIGFGEIVNIKNILQEYSPKAIFLVTGKFSYEKSRAKKIIDSLNEFNFVHFNDFENNPKMEDILHGLKLYKENNCDFCIAIGGGSAIDIAKAINILASHQGDIKDFITGKITLSKPGKVFVAVPTTSGTGSEATHFAAVYIDKVKYSLAHKEFILPDIIILDPELTMTLPAKITAETGMDALCQGIEAYWSVNSTDESKKYSEQAIELAINSLAKVVNNPDRDSRLAMAKAANLAGKAINIAKTTACHAISYPITSYFNIPHGHAAALTLGSMLVYNSQVQQGDVLDKRGVDYVKKIVNNLVKFLGGVSDVDKAKEIIDNLMQEVDLATKLTDVGIEERDLEIIIKNGFNPDRVKNNPRLLTEEALRIMLNKLL
jgi:alcohol dehydrogenase class IV